MLNVNVDFPLASGRNRVSGWTVDFSVLEKIVRKLRADYEETVSPETVENIIRLWSEFDKNA